jgi:hypothetical protein
MLVTNLASDRRRYECSNGLELYDKSNLIFEVSWEHIK